MTESEKKETSKRGGWVSPSEEDFELFVVDFIPDERGRPSYAESSSCDFRQFLAAVAQSRRSRSKDQGAVRRGWEGAGNARDSATADRNSAESGRDDEGSDRDSARSSLDSGANKRDSEASSHGSVGSDWNNIGSGRGSFGCGRGSTGSDRGCTGGSRSIARRGMAFEEAIVPTNHCHVKDSAWTLPETETIELKSEPRTSERNRRGSYAEAVEELGQLLSDWEKDFENIRDSGNGSTCSDFGDRSGNVVDITGDEDIWLRSCYELDAEDDDGDSDNTLDGPADIRGNADTANDGTVNRQDDSVKTRALAVSTHVDEVKTHGDAIDSRADVVRARDDDVDQTEGGAEPQRVLFREKLKRTSERDVIEASVSQQAENVRKDRMSTRHCYLQHVKSTLVLTLGDNGNLCLRNQKDGDYMQYFERIVYDGIADSGFHKDQVVTVAAIRPAIQGGKKKFMVIKSILMEDDITPANPTPQKAYQPQLRNVESKIIRASKEVRTDSFPCFFYCCPAGEKYPEYHMLQSSLRPEEYLCHVNNQLVFKSTRDVKNIEDFYFRFHYYGKS